MSLERVVLILLALPLAVATLVPFKRFARASFYSLAAVAAAAAGTLAFARGPGPGSFALGPLLFTLDEYAYLFVLLVSFGWFLTVIYSSSYVRHHLQAKASAFHAFMALSVATAFGAGMAGNLATALLFYFAGIPTVYPLIRITGSLATAAASRFYLLSTLGPGLLIALPAAAWHFPLTAPFGSYTIASLGLSDARASLALGLLVLGLSKTCVMPFHLWLPRSSAAPTPVTALLHSVSTIQISVILLLRVATGAYGSTLLVALNDHFLETGWLTWLCGVTALYTAWRAMRTADLKKRFAYSTVGQLSYMITAVLVGTPLALTGALLHMVTHAVAKLNLFFCAGVFSTVLRTTEAPKVAAWVPRHRWLAGAAAVSGLSIAGFPFLAGYYSKDLMLLEEIHRHHYAAAAFLLLGSVINLVYIFPIVKAAVVGRAGPRRHEDAVPPAMAFSIAGASAALFWLSRHTYLVTRLVSAR